MSDQAMLKKGSAHRIRFAVTSTAQAKRISKAIKVLQKSSLDKLERKGIVKELNIAGKDDVYAFHVSPVERIVFSPSDGKIFIHDIVDFRNKSSPKSMLKKVSGTKELK